MLFSTSHVMNISTPQFRHLPFREHRLCHTKSSIGHNFKSTCQWIQRIVLILQCSALEFSNQQISQLQLHILPWNPFEVVCILLKSCCSSTISMWYLHAHVLCIAQPLKIVGLELFKNLKPNLTLYMNFHEPCWKF